LTGFLLSSVFPTATEIRPLLEFGPRQLFPLFILHLHFYLFGGSLPMQLKNNSIRRGMRNIWMTERMRKRLLLEKDLEMSLVEKLKSEKLEKSIGRTRDNGVLGNKETMEDC
jgi:hypothetical protein